jgi:Uma2 family endonuclease
MTSSILQEAAAGRAFIKPWTVDEYHRAIELGMLDEDPTYELIDGFIVAKDRAAAGEDIMTVGDRHRIVVNRLVQLSPEFPPRGCFLQSQQPIVVPPHNEPEPDIAIVRGSVDDYMDGPPTGNDVLWVIEVADSSRARDLGAKLVAYATAGIRHYVVVDLANRVVLVHEQPKGETYPAPLVLHPNQRLEIQCPNGTVSVPVERLLP